ncbi:uncharacterized protein LOC123501873 [Portunus trituberculatus]|uniref:uncharacterized protein LOC123501873 n=1 Tax=Portunus trituberculatus TaxID=210409 RepID=UPI001E1CB52E|nr:uncharacterized protein LOC123501873 [Portunus trituberculatus]
MVELKEKAKKIYERSNSEKLKRKFIVVPKSDLALVLGKVLHQAGYTRTVVTTGGKRIGEMVKPGIQKNNEDSVVYQIPCNGSDSSYYGETGRGLATRIKEHQADLRHHRPSSALVDHADKTGNLPNWKGMRAIQSGIEERTRKVLESLYISTNNNINKRTGDVIWATAAALICTPRDRGRQRADSR